MSCYWQMCRTHCSFYLPDMTFRKLPLNRVEKVGRRTLASHSERSCHCIQARLTAGHAYSNSYSLVAYTGHQVHPVLVLVEIEELETGAAVGLLRYMPILPSSILSCIIFLYLFFEKFMLDIFNLLHTWR